MLNVFNWFRTRKDTSTQSVQVKAFGTILTEYGDLIPVVCAIYNINEIKHLPIFQTEDFLHICKVLRAHGYIKCKMD